MQNLSKVIRGGVFLAVAIFGIALPVFAAEVRIKGGFAQASAPFAAAFNIFGVVRSTAGSQPTGRVIFSFPNNFICTLSQINQLDVTAQTTGTNVVTRGMAMCQDPTTPPFSAEVYLQISLNGNSDLIDGFLQLTDPSNTTATIPFVKVTPVISAVP